MLEQDAVDGLGHLIGGRLVTNGSTFPVLNPATGEVIAECPAASTALVDDAMAAAEAALPGWAALSEEERGAVLDRMCQALKAGIDRIDRVASQERGIPDGGAEARVALWYGRHAARQRLPVDVLEDSDERTVKVVLKPVGVVAAIAPWNSPVLIIAEKIFSALAVGNTVVAKPSPFTPLGTLVLADLWKDVVPPGVVNILAGDDAVGKAMVAHPTSRMVSFTGSVPAGRAIAAAVAPDLKNLLLELGGNDAAIVLGDVNVATVAPQIFTAAFVLNGQACMAIKRVYVHESIYADMVAALAELARERVGTMGPLSTQPQYERVKELVSDALRSGAKAVAGGEATPGEGFFFPPTILTDAAPGSRLVDEEQFGPVLPVVPFSDVDWAIDQANGTEFGLSGSIWTADRTLGERLADRLEAGTVWVNHHLDGGPHIPFGGVKASGIGRSNGTAGLHAYAESKTVFIYKDPELV